MRRRGGLGRAAGALALGLAASGAPAEEVTFPAADGLPLVADRYAPEVAPEVAPGGEPRATVLLFHQASGNAGEYAEIGPRLAALGFEAIAVDQRMGGALYMATNRTMAGLAAPVMSFDEVMADLRGALDHARAAPPDAPVILWGSSYSAGLAVILAAEDPEGVAGVLAFSPGNLSVRWDEAEAAARLTVPLFVTYATTASERLEAKALAAAAPDATLFAPEVGAHGSVTLVENHNPAAGRRTGRRSRPSSTASRRPDGSRRDATAPVPAPRAATAQPGSSP